MLAENFDRSFTRRISELRLQFKGRKPTAVKKTENSSDSSSQDENDLPSDKPEPSELTVVVKD